MKEDGSHAGAHRDRIVGVRGFSEEDYASAADGIARAQYRSQVPGVLNAIQGDPAERLIGLQRQQRLPTLPNDRADSLRVLSSRHPAQYLRSNAQRVVCGNNSISQIVQGVNGIPLSRGNDQRFDVHALLQRRQNVSDSFHEEQAGVLPLAAQAQTPDTLDSRIIQTGNQNAVMRRTRFVPARFLALRRSSSLSFHDPQNARAPERRDGRACSKEGPTKAGKCIR